MSARIVFQIADAEIAASAQLSSIDTGGFNKGNTSSFLFVTVTLKGQHYSRGQYAKFTRAINKQFQMPTVVLFKTAANLLTLAFVHRRRHKRDDSRDVLGSVSLIREIDPADPHRAHPVFRRWRVDSPLQPLQVHGGGEHAGRAGSRDC